MAVDIINNIVNIFIILIHTNQIYENILNKWNYVWERGIKKILIGGGYVGGNDDNSET